MFVVFADVVCFFSSFSLSSIIKKKGCYVMCECVCVCGSKTWFDRPLLLTEHWLFVFKAISGRC